MCGIKVAENSTYVVAPKIGGSITYASCEYNGIYGKVKSEWRREGSKTTYSIIVPANVTVKAQISGREYTLTAGNHEFVI